MAKRKKYSPQFKAQVVLELLREEKSVSELASEYGVHPTQLTRWRAEALEKLPQLFENTDETDKLKADYEKRIEDLYSEVGKLTKLWRNVLVASGLDLSDPVRFWHSDVKTGT